jgi:hypothetical protein
MQLVLLGAAVVSIAALQEVSTGLVIIGLTVVNAILGLNQEGKAAESVAALQKMLLIRAHVRRGGVLVEVPSEELVPGDIVSFEAGDKIPADGRLVVAATLEIEEAALTGESTPVGKSLAPLAGGEVPLGDRVDMAYMSSTVTRGRGEMVVTATGMATEVGQISGMLSTVRQEKTPLTRQLDQLTVLITIMAAAALVLVVVIGLLRGDSFDDLFLIGISLAVAAIFKVSMMILDSPRSHRCGWKVLELACGVRGLGIDDQPGLVDLPHGEAFDERSGVVDEDVNRSELARHLVDHRTHRVARADIGPDGDRPASGRGDAVACGRGAALIGVISDRDAGAEIRHHHRRGGPNSG